MATKRKASAHWAGTGAEGSGTLNTSNKFFNDTPYSFKTRFKNEDGKEGTNPEELIAAAHSGCYAMALSFAIAEAGHEAESLDVKAEVVLDEVEGGFGITGITLDLKGKVPGMSEEKFMELAEGAKKGCPISKALSSVPIKLNASFS
ncbi:OsmC family protein [Portibacter lacus]|uniref:Peroxiredoxin n=1 Tax=Portibacter lacus TaxID=1099794 RepID=A0AA37SNT3_9BACT|nr:OsmC family protein [Portibacter lacus]GLR18158.1 peroxiredoxin [Portibacter lacus]